MPRAITHCPKCGQTVTPFAAGCAVCGTDLEAARAARSAKRRIELPRVELPRAQLPRARWYGGVSTGRVDWLHIALAVLAALAIAPVGLFLALFWAARYNREGNTVMSVAMLTVAALALAAMLAPVWFWSHLLHI